MSTLKEIEQKERLLDTFAELAARKAGLEPSHHTKLGALLGFFSIRLTVGQEKLLIKRINELKTELEDEQRNSL